MESSRIQREMMGWHAVVLLSHVVELRWAGQVFPMRSGTDLQCSKPSSTIDMTHSTMTPDELAGQCLQVPCLLARAMSDRSDVKSGSASQRLHTFIEKAWGPWVAMLFTSLFMNV